LGFGTAALAIGVISSGLWLFRSVVGPVIPSGPAPGSLIVNLNTGTESELESIPGIGPARAQQIIARRPYTSVDELVEIPGIGQLTLDGMRPFVTVDQETQER